MDTAEAPASTLSRFATAAQAEGDLKDLPAGLPKNASRAAHRFVNRWGLAWKIPRSYCSYMFGGNPNNVEQIPFVKPSSYIKHFLESAPELLFAGSACADEAH